MGRIPGRYLSPLPASSPVISGDSSRDCLLGCPNVVSKTAKKLKPKKKCCVSSPRCRRCPVRLKAEAKKREKRRKGKKAKKK